MTIAKALGELDDVPVLHITDVGAALARAQAALGQSTPALGLAKGNATSRVQTYNTTLGWITDGAGRRALATWLGNITAEYCCFSGREQARLGMGEKSMVGEVMPEMAALDSHMGTMNSSDFVSVPDKEVMTSEAKALPEI